MIVGGGAAGITIARHLAGKRHRVLVLEGGGRDYDESSQSFYKGASTGQATHALDAGRLRYFGGSSNHWAGWCRPLETADFEPRTDWPESGWPISRVDLTPYYEEAAALCQLGRVSFDDLDYWRRQTGGQAIIPLPLNAGLLQTAVFQMSPPTRFGQIYGPILDSARNIDVLLDATAL